MDVLQFIEEGMKSDGLPFQDQSFKRGAFLCREGDRNMHIYVLREGIVRAFVCVEGQDRTIRLAYAPDMIAVLDSFYTEAASRLNLQCVKSSRVWALKKANFMNWVNASESRRSFYQSYLEQFAVQQLEREIDLLHPSAKERYKRLVERSPQILQEVPHKYIADYLRMSPETLSRITKS